MVVVNQVVKVGQIGVLGCVAVAQNLVGPDCIETSPGLISYLTSHTCASCVVIDNCLKCPWHSTWRHHWLDSSSSTAPVSLPGPGVALAYGTCFLPAGSET